MADVTATSPGDMDPIQQAGVSTSVSNIKNFAHASDLVVQTLLTNMVNSQQSQIAFNQAIQSRCINMLLDPGNQGLANAIEGQEAVKVAQTTPPDTSGALASLAAQVALMTQVLQGLSIAPAAKTTTTTTVTGAATPAQVVAATTQT